MHGLISETFRRALGNFNLTTRSTKDRSTNQDLFLDIRGVSSGIRRLSIISERQFLNMAWKRNKWEWNLAWLYQSVAHWNIFERTMQWSAYTLLPRYQHLRKRTPTFAGIYAWCRLSQRSIIFLFHPTLTGLTKKPHRFNGDLSPHFRNLAVPSGLNYRIQLKKNCDTEVWSETQSPWSFACSWWQVAILLQCHLVTLDQRLQWYYLNIKPLLMCWPVMVWMCLNSSIHPSLHNQQARPSSFQPLQYVPLLSSSDYYNYYYYDLLTLAKCRLVSEIFPQQVFLRSTPEYTEWRNLFWSQQQSESKPACILQPTSSRQVAIALLIARLWNCPFAVKSGGHAAFAGASSITDGLTIDLQRLNTIQLASDKKSVRVGPGNRWIDVYKSLEPQSLTAIGGRVSDIGVGGLTLGGKSFF